ncbi:AbrB/MazE/SpoVT family DNA-binding domain-containing protein [Candidatus Woesearchaeota archaeon]|nr:AbrB/MazE/SpoVT family DNA-binding domain-containing protein [Candidatus Woesearchaeota archaeon]
MIETIKMSSKGQIVIPQDIREDLQLGEGSVFAVVSNQDTIVLKKLETPSKEDLIKELVVMAREGKERLQRKDLKEEDIPELVKRIRKK